MAPVKLEGLAKAVREIKEDAQGVARSIKGGLDFLGWSLKGASTISVNKEQKLRDIDLTITPPKLLAKIAAEVHRDGMDKKHNRYLGEKEATEPGEEIDWGMVRKVIRTKATTPSAKGLLLQGLCDVLITRSWMWEHGMTTDRMCPWQEDSPDHWIKTCSFAAKFSKQKHVGGHVEGFQTSTCV